ncbi:hypothetical protein [Pedobacter heparinus]|uniref:hypothetical protein n=1 Tax=Pedobacter heparinus TaxID=984 RepID=UPI00292D394D|nr:hypothetical protein [Pedobacter heparinus]
MTRDDVAIYAAVLSTFLLMIKLWEMWRDRFRLEAWLDIYGPMENKDLMIVNLSKTPIHIKNITLFWAKSTLKIRKRNYITFDYDLAINIQIGPHATKSLLFKDENSFPINSNQGDLYACFEIAGRKFSCIKKIYDKG